MSLLIIGSIAFDTIETPIDKVEDTLGGSATYICLAAGYFSKPNYIVGVVGDDFKSEHIEMLEKHNTDLQGLQIIKGGKTFRWGGRYHENLNDRDTLFTELNVFETFNPQIPNNLRKTEFVLLGNIDPPLQMNVLNQIESPKFIFCDTMNLWIDIRKKELLEVMEKVDMLVINDSESKMISGEKNIFKAAEYIQKIGPKYLIIKKGEHGAILFYEDKMFSIPAFPLKQISDPTGAGDSFLGGLAGYVARTNDISFKNIKKGIVYGTCMASFCVEHFSTKGLENLSEDEIENRFKEMKELTEF
ncbi:MAG: sugar kinase [Ignavibacteriales bacterium]|nr:sugar kinase [Ignavibacteriales bacterium]